MRYLILINLIFNFIFSSTDSLINEIEILKMKNRILELEKELLNEKIANIHEEKSKKNTPKIKTPNHNFVHNIDIGNSVILGSPNAKVTITKFLDFQ